MTTEYITGIVLAGGGSRRMGTDKAELIWQGKSLLDRAIELLRDVACAHVVVAGRADHPLGMADIDPGAGPAQAILGMLDRLPADQRGVLAIPVDMPLLEATDLTELIGSTACAWQDHPLPVYLPREIVQAPGRNDARSMRQLLALGGGQALDLPGSRRDHFANINTQEDFARLPGSG